MHIQNHENAICFIIKVNKKHWVHPGDRMGEYYREVIFTLYVDR